VVWSGMRGILARLRWCCDSMNNSVSGNNLPVIQIFLRQKPEAEWKPI
jgi:hypothetical protein